MFNSIEHDVLIEALDEYLTKHGFEIIKERKVFNDYREVLAEEDRLVRKIQQKVEKLSI